MTKHILVIANRSSKYYLGTIKVLSKEDGETMW